MQPKHNKQLVPLAKQLRKEMTKNGTYGMIFCGPTLSVFPDKRCWENISLTSIAQKQSLSLSWTVLNTMRIETSKKMQTAPLFWRDMV